MFFPGQSHVNLLSDANLRRYCTAAQPCCLSLGIGAAQSGTSLEDYVVARERAKADSYLRSLDHLRLFVHELWMKIQKLRFLMPLNTLKT